MSISGLSEHLCPLAQVIIIFLVASLVFQPAYTNASSYDFANSRQFRKNIAVSKYRNNTYWLPNYTWKPPEKIYGPRKKPSWEAGGVTESAAEKKKREEFEEWEKKMREVTNRQRHKWNTWENTERRDSPNRKINSSGNNMRHKTEDEESKKSFKKKLEDESNGLITLPNNLRNGRWGMTGIQSVAPGFFGASSEKLGTDSPNVKNDEEKKFEPDIASKHRSMGIEEGAEKSDRKLSQMEDERSKSWTQDDDRQRTNIALEDGGIWRSGLKRSDVSSESKDSRIVKNRRPILMTFPPGRWGSSVKEPPKEFLEEMRRRFGAFKISNGAWTRDEDRARAGNKNFYDAEEDQGRRKSTGTGRASTKLPNDLPTDLWSTSESLPPRKFLREISRLGHTGVGGFYKLEPLRQLAGVATSINVPPSQEMIYFRMPNASNVFFFLFCPRIPRAPMFFQYSIRPKQFANYYFTKTRCVECKREGFRPPYA